MVKDISKKLEDYLGNNLNFQFIEIICDEDYLDIWLNNFSPDMTKEQYDKMLDILEKHRMTNNDYSIRFSYDISGYEYIMNDEYECSYLVLTVCFSNSDIVSKIDFKELVDHINNMIYDVRKELDDNNIWYLI